MLHDKVFVGGGIKKFSRVMKGRIKNNVEIHSKVRYYNNTEGFCVV